MDISPFLIYLWGQVDTIASYFQGTFFALVTICCIGAYLISIFVPAGEWATPEMPVKIASGSKKIGIIAALIYTFGVFIPSSKTVALMYVIPKIANSAAVQKDLPEIYDVAIKALKEKIGAVNPEVKAEAKAEK